MSNIRSDWMSLILTIHAELVVRLFSEDRENDSSVSVPTRSWSSADCVLKFATCLHFIDGCYWVNMTRTSPSTHYNVTT
jgi:hypothetical protein